ncbi:MAG TPA: DUF1501 domain-containing protein, partial [Planctomycetaceae bacterium]
MTTPSNGHVPPAFGLTRREMLTRCGMGLGAYGLAALLGENVAPAAEAAKSSMSPKAPHFPAKAKHVIHIFMNGGISHVDTFDPKPTLAKHAGKELPTNLKTERKTGA